MGVLAPRSPARYTVCMARLCSVCQHPQRSDIDKALSSPTVRVSRLAEAFSIPINNLRRHRDKCIARTLAKTLEKQELALGNSLLTDVSAIRGKVATILDNCGEKDTAVTNNRDFNATIKSYLSTIEHIGKLSGHPAYQSNHQQVSIDARGGKFLLMPYSGEALRELGPGPEPTDSSD